MNYKLWPWFLSEHLAEGALGFVSIIESIDILTSYINIVLMNYSSEIQNKSINLSSVLYNKII